MPEDRLGDLGRRGGASGDAGDGGASGGPGEPGEGRGRRQPGEQGEGGGPPGAGRDRILGDDPRPAGERLAELDERRPEQPFAEAGAGTGHPPPRRRGGRYLGVVAIAFAALIVYAAFDAARNVSSDRGLLRGPAPGSRLPDFAAPLATGSLAGDANVRRSGQGGEAAGNRPACEVRSPEVVNVCELRERPLVLTFIVTRGADCAPALDTVERVRRDFPQVAFAAAVSGSEREEVERLVRERGIGMPVAVDPDGALANLYRIGVCPTTVLSAPGGEVRATRIGGLGEEELRREVRALVGERRR